MYSLSAVNKVLGASLFISLISACAVPVELRVSEQEANVSEEFTVADEVQIEAIDNTQATIEETEAPSLEVTESEVVVLETHTCPKQFYQVQLPSDGKLCQVFAAELPASMIFFVPKSPSEVIRFYSQDPEAFAITKQVKDRYMLQTSDKNTTLIISSDGKGTQVDILVKTSNS